MTGAGKVPGGGGPALNKRQRKQLRDLLLAARRHFGDQISSLKAESLQRLDSANSADDGTDAFERQCALMLASSDHETVAEIDNALMRLEEGTYGVCESCDCRIPFARLIALPFVRNCVRCQAEAEKIRPKLHAVP